MNDQSKLPPCGILMPKFPWRFRVLFDNFGAEDCDLLTDQIVSVSRPSATAEPIPENGGYRAGPLVWDDLTLVVLDDITNGASKLIHAQITAQQIYPTVTFDMTIETTDDNGETIETWRCQNCSIRRFNNGVFTYEGGSPMTIILTIKSENIILS